MSACCEVTPFREEMHTEVVAVCFKMTESNEENLEKLVFNCDTIKFEF